MFLEAHRQNTINFSEASFSTGLIRFGEISVAMVLQTVLPLAIVFLGFGDEAQAIEGASLSPLTANQISSYGMKITC